MSSPVSLHGERRTQALAAALFLSLALAGPALAQPGGRPAVDDAIRRALQHEKDGRTTEALTVMRAIVQHSAFRDGKARYFLARFYEKRRAELQAAGDRAAAREHHQLSLLHLRGARALPDAEWARHATDRLLARARSTPLMSQYDEGGSYPSGYCGPTALRMVLRLEGLRDPGADATALQGARPYEPGQGSWGARLGQRARELGLAGAEFTTTGTLADVVASLEDGRPVLMSGSGSFSARFEDGAARARTYGSGHYLVAVGFERDAQGRVSRLVFNDSDTGRRLSMSVAAVRTFFRDDGDMWMVTYDT